MLQIPRLICCLWLWQISTGKENFTFFYREESPFSQFHPAAFSGPSLFPSKDDGNLSSSTDDSDTKIKIYRFHWCEQWMMFNKAELFRDTQSARAILKAKTPLACKRLGRQVINFQEGKWKKYNRIIIYAGNYLKFTQNPHLLEALKTTAGTTLAEASPRDTIYGIGLSATDSRAQSRGTWKGNNLLGEVLTELRKNIFFESMQTWELRKEK